MASGYVLDLSNLNGGPPLTTFACTIPAEVAPSLRFLQGSVAIPRAQLILLWTRDQTHLAPAFPTPAWLFRFGYFDARKTENSTNGDW